MAVSSCVSRSLSALSRTLRISQPATRKLYACANNGRCEVLRNRLPCGISAACIHTGTFHSTVSPTITVTDEPDQLNQKVSVLVKGHDKAVLDSYEFFATLAAQELGISIGKVFEPPKNIERMTLLKSVHIFKKHRVQYEMRTHFRCIELERVTGSTAEVYLEYIQRNLPEGVAMVVTKTAIEKIPEHILAPMWNNQQEQPSQ